LQLVTTRVARQPISVAALRLVDGRTSALARATCPSTCVPTPAPLLQLLSGARRWKGRGNHKMGGARAQPIRKKPKLRRNPELGKKYKLKSHKGALKRFYQKGDGTFMHKACGKRHLQAGTSRKRQTLRKMAHRPVTAKGIIKKLKRLMPYGTTLQPAPRFKVSRLWERPDDWRERVAAAVRAVQEAAAGKPKAKGKKQQAAK